MHRTKTGEFLMELARYGKSDEVFSYLAGFLCHYALDSTAHPLVYQLQKDKGYMHMAIEHRLDVIELERQGKQFRDIMQFFSPFPNLSEIRKVMNKVYGWDDDYYRIGYEHTKAFFWIVKDQRGILDFLLSWTNSKFAALSYRTHLCDDMDLSEFDELEHNAVDMTSKLIKAAYNYRIGQIDEESLETIIGNRSYAGEDADVEDAVIDDMIEMNM